jgi:FixJ family two-component response regulator
MKLVNLIEFDPDASIVMVTSVVNAQFIQKIMSEGAMDAVKKPINEAKLQKIFDNLE